MIRKIIIVFALLGLINIAMAIENETMETAGMSQTPTPQSQIKVDWSNTKTLNADANVYVFDKEPIGFSVQSHSSVSKEINTPVELEKHKWELKIDGELKMQKTGFNISTPMMIFTSGSHVITVYADGEKVVEWNVNSMLSPKIISYTNSITSDTKNSFNADNIQVVFQASASATTTWNWYVDGQLVSSSSVVSSSGFGFQPNGYHVVDVMISEPSGIALDHASWVINPSSQINNDAKGITFDSTNYTTNEDKIMEVNEGLSTNTVLLIGGIIGILALLITGFFLYKRVRSKKEMQKEMQKTEE